MTSPIIVHITTVHARRDMRIFRKQCVTLAAEFSSVHLIVSDGLRDEIADGVRITDIGIRPHGRFSRMLKQPWLAYRAARALGAEVVHFHDPELLLVGLVLSWRGARVIYDSHEDVPRQILSKHWIPEGARKAVSYVFERFENFIVRRIAGVVAATPHIAERFVSINSNTIDVNNYPIDAELTTRIEGASRRSQVCYVGTISRTRGLRPVIEAMASLPDVRLVLGGKFSEDDFRRELEQLPGWARVDYRGHMEREQVREVLAESVAGLVTLFPTPAYLDSLPVKMFEYMAAGLPVIASDFPLWREILEGTGAGVCVNPSSPSEIADAVRQFAGDLALADRTGAAGRRAVATGFNWHNEAQKLIGFYRGIS